MSNEICLLKLFCESREDFEKGAPYIVELKNMEREIKVIFNLISRYYKNYTEHNYIGKEELICFYDMQYPGSKEREIYVEIINDIYHKPVSTDIMQDMLERVIEQHHAAAVMSRLVPVIEGNKFGVLPQIVDDVDEFVAKLRTPPSIIKAYTPCEFSLQDLVSTELTDSGISWPSKKLTDTIGGVKSKTLGLIYAFVDTGKTSFGVKCCAHFANQLAKTSYKIAYAGNEESASRIALRLTQAITNSTRREIISDPKAIEDRRRLFGWDQIMLFDNVSHIATVEKLLDRYRPRILFIDQGTKVSTDFRSDNETYSAQYLFNWYRERAKLYDTTIICLAQATGEAENRKYLRLSDIFGSRVPIQGELDFAIGIGRTLDDIALADIRFFSVPKNKLAEGDPVKFEMKFVRERCNFIEV